MWRWLQSRLRQAEDSNVCPAEGERGERADDEGDPCESDEPVPANDERRRDDHRRDAICDERASEVLVRVVAVYIEVELQVDEAAHQDRRCCNQACRSSDAELHESVFLNDAVDQTWAVPSTTSSTVST